MWAHYAKSHTGFVVEFDSMHEFFGSGDLLEVRYDASRPELSNPQEWKEIVTTKSPEWSYEREVPIGKAAQEFDDKKS